MPVINPTPLTFPGSLVIASGKTFTVSNSLTLAGTDGRTMTFPTTNASIARTDTGQTFTGDQIITGSLNTGNATFFVNSSTFNAQLWNGGAYAWTSGASSNNPTPDLFLYRDAPNTLGQRNATTAQRAFFYNTFTTALTAGEWWKSDWAGTANQFRMGAVAGSSSGTNRVASWDYGDKLASATAAITVPATSGNIVFGGGVQLSNAAVTGLVAGAVAALTTATIVLFDSTGQAYRVPCVI